MQIPNEKTTTLCLDLTTEHSLEDKGNGNLLCDSQSLLLFKNKAPKHKLDLFKKRKLDIKNTPKKIVKFIHGIEFQ